MSKSTNDKSTENSSKSGGMKRIQYHYEGIPSSFTIDPLIFELLDQELDGLGVRWCKRVAREAKLGQSERNDGGVSQKVRQMAILKIAKPELIEIINKKKV